MTTSDESAQRRAARAERARHHRSAHTGRRERESAKAQVLVDQFVADAVRASIPTEELTARPWSGRGRYRTGIVGWYLRNDHSIGVSTDAGYYVLTVAPRRLGRWRGVALEPSPPPLQVGEGGRDGDSIALDALLRLRLAW